MEIINTLQNLDLSKNESAVYVELLKLGRTNAGPIVTSSKLHRQLVYEALDKLIEKKLVSFVIKNNRKYFQAASPSALLKIIDEKKEQAHIVIPELMKLQNLADEQIEVRTLYGQKGFFDNLKDIIESAARTDKIMRIIGGMEDASFYKTLGDLYPKYLELLKTHKVKKHLISPEKFSAQFKKIFARQKGDILKTMEEGLSSPTYTRITPEMVSIEIYSSDVIIIQIYNQAIAKSYLEHFDLLWKQAKSFFPKK